MFYYLIRKLLFLMDPEKSHIFTLKCLNSKHMQIFINLFLKPIPSIPVKCMGLVFPNKVGLAAGMDKNGEYINFFNKLGFGFIELGTVTPLPQVGNLKPRIFRIPSKEAIINKMGFNNLGIENLICNIKKSKFKGIIGVNIGKNTQTPIENSINDYLICIEKIYCYTDYIAINISSPNTKNLRNLQYGILFNNLLENIKTKQKEMHQKYSKYVPIAIKISPDLSKNEIIDISNQLIKFKIDAVIATNTTLDHSKIYKMQENRITGGLSGFPLQSKSNTVISILYKQLKKKVPIIGVGGINSLNAAKEKIQLGAELIQIYSGLVYHGPKFIRHLIKKL
ncbi:quinone-dependent dihydroorotate dehydrogenase [Buchnera aphidicola (Aphis aurantii)]|uniref:quinone-dependent dihydroorotate dehydrogenase n=1 Tax=Buchnera aphidicola TaxID=9 RepID=UPI0031B72334